MSPIQSSPVIRVGLGCVGVGVVCGWVCWGGGFGLLLVLVFSLCVCVVLLLCVLFCCCVRGISCCVLPVCPFPLPLPPSSLPSPGSSSLAPFFVLRSAPLTLFTSAKFLNEEKWYGLMYRRFRGGSPTLPLKGGGGGGEGGLSVCCGGGRWLVHTFA